MLASSTKHKDVAATRIATHPKQAERLSALRSYDIIDTPRESDFDDIAELASQICDAPISLVTFVEEDRQWFKAAVGAGDLTETTTEVAICSHAILQNDVFVIGNMATDPRTANNPLVTGQPNVRFYAGAVLKTDEGLPLGTICVLDTKPRDLSEKQKFALEVLAKQVMTQLELRKTLRFEKAARIVAEEKTGALNKTVNVQNILMSEIDHRVKNSLQMVTSLLRIQGARAESDETIAALKVAEQRVQAISAVHSELHSASSYEHIDMYSFIERLTSSLHKSFSDNIVMEVDVPRFHLDSSKAGAFGILLNEFVTNSLKYAFPDNSDGKISITGHLDGDNVHLNLCDSGIGFDYDSVSQNSKGLGVRVIKATANQLGAKLQYHVMEKGACITLDFNCSQA